MFLGNRPKNVWKIDDCMSTSTAIQWTDQTDNIIVVKGGGWWCRKISPGCANCYAATLNQNSFYGGNKLAYSGDVPELMLRREILDGWARMRKPKKHFVASMTDVFGEWVDIEWQFEMLDAMATAKDQTFQVLTKRAEHMVQVISLWLLRREFRRVPANIWLGVSVENNACRTRIGHLRSIPCVRFVSFEPLLEDLPDLELGGRDGIDWVIVGGESGDRARACDVKWIRSIVRQCAGQGVAYFVKQLGVKAFQSPEHDGGTGYFLGLKHPKGGDVEEWPEDLKVREFPKQFAGPEAGVP
jgi:protein gp37